MDRDPRQRERQPSRGLAPRPPPVSTGHVPLQPQHPFHRGGGFSTPYASGSGQAPMQAPLTHEVLSQHHMRDLEQLINDGSSQPQGGGSSQLAPMGSGHSGMRAFASPSCFVLAKVFELVILCTLLAGTLRARGVITASDALSGAAHKWWLFQPQGAGHHSLCRWGVDNQVRVIVPCPLFPTRSAPL
jgi:hypothetical protein